MTINIDFYGESTSCGYVSAQERDNPTPAAVSNPANAGWMTVGPDTAVGGDYANVPRRVVERLTNDASLPSARRNYAVSSTPVQNILDKIENTSGASDGVFAVVNTGINDAVLGTTLTDFRTRLAAVLTRIVRTGKVAVLVRPNSLANTTWNNLLSDYYTDIPAWLAGLGLTSNVVYVTTSVGGAADGTHPDNAGYEYLSWRIASEINARPARADLPLERTIAELYVLFFNRVPEQDGAAFWLNPLRSYGEAHVAGEMYKAVPAMQAMTPEQLVTTWYSHLFSEAPDQEGLDFWVAALANQGVGLTAKGILDAVRNQTNTTHKKKLTHKANVGVTYGYRLARTPVNTTLLNGVTADPSTVYAATATL